ncbi:MAG TPA: ribulose phosphate epimerase [Clostridiales bacterium]|nr:ribulose phosphate epimerase [Clostridiales bacterium]
MRKVTTEKKLLVAASVSCMDMMHMQKCMEETEAAGIDFYHYDIVDGTFNTCFILGQTLLESMRARTEMPIEVHLAVEEPMKFIEQYARLGADYIGVHYESKGDIAATLDAVLAAGATPTLQLRAETAFKEDMMPLFEKVAWVNKLTVNPGYSGQTMQPQALEHIRGIRDAIERAGLAVRLQADGNIKEETIPLVVRAGADILTGGTSGLFARGNTVAQNITKMREAAQAAL